MTIQKLHVKYRLVATSLRAMASSDMSGEMDMCPGIVQDLADELLALNDQLDQFDENTRRAAFPLAA